MSSVYPLSVTTQGPSYPPSEVMNQEGDFVVIGRLNRPEGQGWGAAIVAVDTEIPPFGRNVPYQIKRELDLNAIASGKESDFVLHTLPVPLAGNNYPIEFAPEQRRQLAITRPHQPLHAAHVPDERPQDGRKNKAPITLRQWLRAEGTVQVHLGSGDHSAHFSFLFRNMIPDSLYTIMALRAHDLRPENPTRPGPLGIPNVFLTDEVGNGRYRVEMPNPFGRGPDSNPIVNIVILYMSSQMSYGGAIGYYGLGGDIHAHLKLKSPAFYEFSTSPKEDLWIANSL